MLEWPQGGTAYDWGCFALEYLGLCGCGRPEDNAAFIRDGLLLLKNRSDDPAIWKSQIQELADFFGRDCGQMGEVVLNLWDSRGWLEHGSTIWGSWLTEDGERAILVAEAMIKLEGGEEEA